MQTVFVKDLMAKNPVFADPDDTLEDAAVEMKNVDCGVLPVGTKSNIKGMITDRDIIVRAVAAGKDPAKEKVRNYMTAKALFCNENDTIKDATETMKKNKVSRLIVKNDSDRISGILSFGHILRENTNAAEIADVITDVAGRSEKAA